MKCGFALFCVFGECSQFFRRFDSCWCLLIDFLINSPDPCGYLRSQELSPLVPASWRPFFRADLTRRRNAFWQGYFGPGVPQAVKTAWEISERLTKGGHPRTRDTSLFSITKYNATSIRSGALRLRADNVFLCFLLLKFHEEVQTTHAWTLGIGLRLRRQCQQHTVFGTQTQDEAGWH